MAWFVRRVLLLVVSIFVASIVIFVLLRLLPGDLAQSIGGLEATPAQLDKIRERFGLDRPLYRQYAEWISGVVVGDFGSSALTRKSVVSELTAKLSVSAPLVVASTVLSLVLAIPLGIIAAARHRRRDGVALSALSQLGIAMPSFLVGLMLVIVFATRLGWFPPAGFARRGWDTPFEAAKRLVLPSLTLGLAQGAVLFRFVRSATLDVLHQDYLRTARAKGLTRTQALVRHGLRNASLPVISILGIQVATLIAGVVVIERVFNLPGVGQMLVKDVGQRDISKVQGTVLLLAIVVLVVGFLVDVVHRAVDPRLRASR